jgi:hypothetical protein
MRIRPATVFMAIPLRRSGDSDREKHRREISCDGDAALGNVCRFDIIVVRRRFDDEFKDTHIFERSMIGRTGPGPPHQRNDAQTMFVRSSIRGNGATAILCRLSTPENVMSPQPAHQCRFNLAAPQTALAEGSVMCPAD